MAALSLLGSLGGGLHSSRLSKCVCGGGPDPRGAWAAQNPDLQQLLQMWRAGRVSLLAVVLNHVLSSVSTKLGAGAPGCRASCLCCTQTAGVAICSLSMFMAACPAPDACSMLSSVEHMCTVAIQLAKNPMALCPA